MFRLWKFMCLLAVLSIIVAGCGKSIEDQSAAGVESARQAFFDNDKKQTQEIGDIKFYKPSGFTMEENSDAQNIVLTKNNETYIVFINPNEENDSHLFYDLFTADQNRKVIKQDTFEKNGSFGFAAVTDLGEGKFECIASVGGAKMTTVSKKSQIDNDLAEMMKVVRSIEQQ